MPVIACKLPSGLTIKHNNVTIVLRGANSGEDRENVSRNGSPNDNANRASGYGLTEVNDAQAKAYADWVEKASYVDGIPAKGKLTDIFPALENGSLLGPFKSIDEARKEVNVLASSIETGFEGLDPTKEGVEKLEDDKKKR